MGNTTSTTSYTITISESGTTLTIDAAKDNAQVAKALNEYAGTKFSEDASAPKTDSLAIKSKKWGNAGTSNNSAISATVIIDNETDAVTVDYSENVDNYSDHGTIESSGSAGSGSGSDLGSDSDLGS